MTNKDVFVQVLHEVTGLPKSRVAELAKAFKHTHGAGNWEKELPEKKAEELLMSLRSEKEGIKAWLIRGNYLAEQEWPQSTA